MRFIREWARYVKRSVRCPEVKLAFRKGKCAREYGRVVRCLDIIEEHLPNTWSAANSIEEEIAYMDEQRRLRAVQVYSIGKPDVQYEHDQAYSKSFRRSVWN